MRPLPSRFRPIFLAVIWLCGAYAVFVLPYRFPTSRRIDSDSYAVGFNNGAALLGLGATLLALFCFHLAVPTGARNWNQRIGQLFKPFPIARSEVWFPLAFALVHCIFMWSWYRFIPTANYGEMGYTVSRVELILLGQVPYQDFEWNYGPFLLYLPVFLVRLSQNQLSSDQAYMLSLVFFTFFSFSAVYYVLAQLRLFKTQRVIIFFLVCSSFNLALGANGTHTRFIAPFAALFFLHRLALKATHPIVFTGAAALLVCGCFLISPETGVIWMFGLLIFGATRIRNGDRRGWSAVLIAPALGIAPILAFSSSYGRSLATFGGGASNFPVVPSGPILFYLCSLLFLVPLLGISAWRSRLPQSALALALGAMMVVFSAPALGRCDVGHVFYNGLGLFLIALALLLRLRVRFQPYALLFFVCFTLAYPFVYGFQYSGNVAAIFRQRARGTEKVDRNFLQASFRVSDPALQKLQAELALTGQIGTPLGIREDVEILLKRAGQYTPEYFPYPSLEVRTPSQLARKLADVSRMKTVLVEAKKLRLKPFDRAAYARQQEKFVSQVVLYPVSYRLKNLPLFAEREIVRYLNSNFRKTATFGPFVLLKNRRFD